MNTAFELARLVWRVRGLQLQQLRETDQARRLYLESLEAALDRSAAAILGLGPDARPDEVAIHPTDRLMAQVRDDDHPSTASSPDAPV